MNFRHCCFTLLVTMNMNLLANAAEESAVKKYSAKVWKSPAGESLNYRFRTPDKVKQGEAYPLVVFLHGAGGRGNDNRGELTDAGMVGAFEQQGIGSKRPAYVIAGQVPNGQLWVNVPWSTLDHRMPEVSESMRMMLEAVDAVVKDPAHQIDRKRIYIVGLSMGGYGTWDALQRRPDFFAAAIPICGGGDKMLAKTISEVPVWVWHGAKDGAIKVSRSRDMVAALKAAGGSPKYTEIGERGHNVWTDVWKSTEAWDWLFAQSK